MFVEMVLTSASEVWVTYNAQERDGPLLAQKNHKEGRTVMAVGCLKSVLKPSIFFCVVSGSNFRRMNCVPTGLPVSL